MFVVWADNKGSRHKKEKDGPADIGSWFLRLNEESYRHEVSLTVAPTALL